MVGTLVSSHSLSPLYFLAPCYLLCQPSFHDGRTALNLLAGSRFRQVFGPSHTRANFWCDLRRRLQKWGSAGLWPLETRHCKSLPSRQLTQAQQQQPVGDGNERASEPTPERHLGSGGLQKPHVRYVAQLLIRPVTHTPRWKRLRQKRLTFKKPLLTIQNQQSENQSLYLIPTSFPFFKIHSNEVLNTSSYSGSKS